MKGIQQQYDVNLSFQHSCEISQENPDVSRDFPGIPALPFDPGNSGNSRQFQRIVKNYFNRNYITGSSTVLVFTKSVNSNFRARVLIGSRNSEYTWPFTVLRPEPRWRLVSRHFQY